VSISPHSPPRLLRSETDEGDISRWSLVSLDAADDFASALVVESPRIEVRTHEFAW